MLTSFIIYCLFGIVFTVTKIRKNVPKSSIWLATLMGYFFFFVTWPVWVFLFFKSWLFSKNEFDMSLMRESSVPLEWLMNKVSIQEAEQENTYIPPYSKKSVPVPFGNENATWNDIKSKMLEGDEVWRFRNYLKM